MAQLERERNRDRLKAAVGVGAFHALLGYALISGLGYEVVTEVTDNLKLINIRNEPPPPPIEEAVRPQEKAKDPEGAASPPSLKAKPTPVVAPPPKIRLEVPPRVTTVPKATPLPPGNDPSAGSSTMDGPGTGSGGLGDGTGSGGQGTGTGGGGGGNRAQLVRGYLTNSDYPSAARRAGAEGGVSVRFIVGTDGRASRCVVTRSSGHPELDQTTCRLIEKRFRYRPARNAQGTPIAETVNKHYDWFIRRPPPDLIDPLPPEN